MRQRKSCLCTVRSVYGFKWGLKTWRDEKAVITKIGCKAFNIYILGFPSGPRTCRQGKVVTMCLVRIFRHTLELSTTVIGSSLHQLPLSSPHFHLRFKEKRKTQWYFIEMGILCSKLSSFLHH